MDEKELSRYEVEGQITMDEWLSAEPPAEMVGVSKVFARARKSMSLPEFKAFVYCLCHIRWKEDSMPATVYLDKKTLARVLGINPDPGHLAREIRLQIGNLVEHSIIEFSAKDRRSWEKGALITQLSVKEDRVVGISFNPRYKALFCGLEKDFILLWSKDIFQMRAERSILLYEYLRLNCDTRLTNVRVFSVDQLRELLNIPANGAGSYLRKDGRFDRHAFETKVLDPICKDLLRCQMVQLVQEDGEERPYRRIKRGRRLIGYEFVWEVSNRPRVADAHTTQETRHLIEKNPKVMKIAVDAAAGVKRGNATKKNQFTDFENQNTGIDFDSLEEELLARTAAHLREEERN